MTKMPDRYLTARTTKDEPVPLPDVLDQAEYLNLRARQKTHAESAAFHLRRALQFRAAWRGKGYGQVDELHHLRLEVEAMRSAMWQIAMALADEDLEAPQ